MRGVDAADKWPVVQQAARFPRRSSLMAGPRMSPARGPCRRRRSRPSGDRCRRRSGRVSWMPNSAGRLATIAPGVRTKSPIPGQCPQVAMLAQEVEGRHGLLGGLARKADEAHHLRPDARTRPAREHVCFIRPDGRPCRSGRGCAASPTRSRTRSPHSRCVLSSSWAMSCRTVLLQAELGAPADVHARCRRPARRVACRCAGRDRVDREIDRRDSSGELAQFVTSPTSIGRFLAHGVVGMSVFSP